jgi:radical SAM protein with 4Fe4S-binding SPASM domain
MCERSSTIKSIELLKFTADKKPLRFLLRQFSGFCKKDNKNRLEVALELYVKERNSACWACTHIVAPIVEWVARKGAKAFEVNEEDFKEKFKNVYWRRGLVNVIRGIAKFGIQKPFVPGAPFLVVWNYTYLCNLRCKHCYASAGKPHPNELTTEEAKKVVEKFADAGVNIIAFSGGEPLMRKDFYEIAKLARDHGIFTAVATNATLITKEIAKKLKETGIGYVQISLDGARPETHDNFRGILGVFEKTIRGIKNCVEEGIFVEVSTTATKFTYKEIPEVIDLCEKLGVNWWMMYNFVPTGRGRFIIENDLTPKEREELLKFLWKRLREGRRMQVLSTAPQFARVALQMEEQYGKESKEIVVPTHFYNPHLHGQLLNLSEFIGGCGAGRFYCALDPDGTITPCVFFPLPVGNIREDDFEEIWDNHPVFWDLRNREKLKGHCGECEFKYVCGGCRARGYGYFGDYLAPDPGCINNRFAWENLRSEMYKYEVLPTQLHGRSDFIYGK